MKTHSPARSDQPPQPSPKLRRRSLLGWATAGAWPLWATGCGGGGGSGGEDALAQPPVATTSPVVPEAESPAAAQSPAGPADGAADFVPEAAAFVFPEMPVPATAKRLGLCRIDEHNYQVWRPLGGPRWQRCSLSRAGAGLPFSWNETWIKQVYGYVTATQSACSYGGGWSDTVSGTYNLFSADPKVYVNGRAKQATTPGQYVDIVYSGGGDLWVVFTGRASGGHVEVLLDGAQDHLVLPLNQAGRRYFDAYTAADLSHKQVVMIAAGLPEGVHTVRLTLSSFKNAASSGTRFIFVALACDSDALGPWSAASDARPWVARESVLLDEERQHAGRYYYALAGGTTGALPPTHLTGTVSDGAVSWVARAASSHAVLDHRIQAPGSQLEYAYLVKPDGTQKSEDVGGALHGNETQTGLQIRVDGRPAQLADGEWLVGDVIEVAEEIAATHSEARGGAAPVMVTRLRRRFTRPWIEISHTHTLQVDATLGYFYAHMWPLLHYSSAGFKYGLRKLSTAGDGDSSCANFYGQANPFIGRTRDYVMVGEGDALQPNGAGGVPDTGPAPYRFTAWLAIDPASVDSFTEASHLFAAKAMNTSGADVAAGGYSSMTSKMYFERYSSPSPRSKRAGYSFTCTARYGLVVDLRA